jgi:hypothetical protein
LDGAGSFVQIHTLMTGDNLRIVNQARQYFEKRSRDYSLYRQFAGLPFACALVAARSPPRVSDLYTSQLEGGRSSSTQPSHSLAINAGLQKHGPDVALRAALSAAPEPCLRPVSAIRLRSLTQRAASVSALSHDAPGETRLPVSRPQSPAADSHEPAIAVHAPQHSRQQCAGLLRPSSLGREDRRRLAEDCLRHRRRYHREHDEIAGGAQLRPWGIAAGRDVEGQAKDRPDGCCRRRPWRAGRSPSPCSS